MITEPETVIPKLAAQLHVNVVESVVNAVFANMPQVLRQITENQNANSEAERAFYSAWPSLKDPKHAAVVRSAVATYRQLNPTATRDEVIKAAGLQASISLRLPIPPELFDSPASAATQPAPFVPAAPAAPGVTPQPLSSETNPFSVLAQEFISDDRGG
jgi:hypothetical protein